MLEKNSKKILYKKLRDTWNIKPITRIKDSAKIYNRKKDKRSRNLND